MTGQFGRSAPSCRVLLCYAPAKGSVLVNALQAERPTRLAVAMCQDCSDAVAGELERGRRPAVTAGGELCWSDLTELLRGRR